MKMRSSPRLAKRTKISPEPEMSSSKQEASMKEKGSAKRKLDLGAEPDGDEGTAENNDVEVNDDVELPPLPPLPGTAYELGRIQRMRENDVVYKSLGLPTRVADKGKEAEEIKKQKNKNRCPQNKQADKEAEGDEYIPENEGEDDIDDSLKRKKIVKSKKAGSHREGGPTTRSRANAAVGNDKKLADVVTPIKKQPKTAGNNREATSSYHPPLVKPTCSKLFKQSINREEAGSVAAYLAMRERQKQGIAAPTMEDFPELGEEGIETEEVETVRAPRKPRGRSKMSQVHARGPDEKVVINVNEEGQPISDEEKTVTELSNFLGTLVKDNARYVIPVEGHKWVMHTLNESWRRHKSMIKKAHYRKYNTDEERLENRPDTIPLEDFKMLLNYWGDESVKENAARRNKLAETHTMGPRTHAQAKEKLMQVRELVNAGKIAEANALVHGGKPHGRNWLVGRKGKKPTYDTTPAAPSDQYVQELSAKIKQDLEADLEAKVNVKVKENMSWMLKKLRDANPSLKFDITDLCATASSDQDDNGTPFTQGGTDN
ncbi:hypothetical protein OROMI_014286 [Orobanche minor]